jgi:hypothetical protein
MFLGLMGLEERKERPNYSPTLRRGRGVVESYVTLQLTVGRLLSRFCEGGRGGAPESSSLVARAGRPDV